MDMPERRIRTFTVLPCLPEKLRPLREVAYNLSWCWNHEAIYLFRRIDEQLFEKLENSPVKLLGAVEPARWRQLADDEGFMAHLNRVVEALEEYKQGRGWFQDSYPTAANCCIAYFSAEFGIHDSIPVYSGGLGVLAGDHIKSASDLGVPLVGVSLMYRLGYFRQYFNQDGWQQERYPENDFYNLPLQAEYGPDGKPVMISVTYPGRDVRARIWRIQVGRVPLFLLDTNLPENRPEDREITGQLYGGDQDLRIRQEMMLGIGGLRALNALGRPPTVCHMNQGHSAFLGLERIRLLMEKDGLTFDEAREAVTAGNVFTTHTPVPAGIDQFPPDLVGKYLGNYLAALKLEWRDFMALARTNPNDQNENFSMPILALRLANVSNGVSRLHGQVSRRMWRKLWPDLPESEIPITSITNGIHPTTWLSPELAQLYDRYLGTQWRERPGDHTPWSRVENIPDAELWRTHERRRERLVVFARKRLRMQLQRRGVPAAEIHRAEEALDPEALTIGFARRFATYKRGNLIFRNLERLTHIVNNKERPVQFIFAGKAHPRDHSGKELIAEIVHFARRPELRRRVVFLEDYDMNLARYMLQGVDVWLNNPRRPQEASGTSGMKAAINGGLNFSVLDGWWCEGYQQDNGWSIGAGEEYSENEKTYQDDVESRAIYDLLEQEIVPLYYTRGSDGLPRGWLRMVKRSLHTLCPVFNTHRMVQEYVKIGYWPSHLRFIQLTADKEHAAKQLAAWRKRIEKNWSQVHVDAVDAKGTDGAVVGQELPVQARIRLGSLAPGDVEVQLVHGPMDSLGDISSPRTIVMTHQQSSDNGAFVYNGLLPCSNSGQQGFSVRVLPKHPGLANPISTGLVCWG
jgi:starch phosphorylase